MRSEQTEPPAVDWNLIDTVLLDMDGTLLDRHFDDHFWLEHVPHTWSRLNGVPLPVAKDHLYKLFRSQEQTLNWTNLDYWSEQLGLDIPLLKLEIDHLIAVHPGVVDFLIFLKRQKKQAYLVTNAHTKTVKLKMSKTSLSPYFIDIITAHDLGLPKEDPAFWGRLQKQIPYDPDRTLLGEDSETNLGTARAFGIRHLIYVSRYSSTVEPLASPDYHSIHYFTELMT